MNGLYGDNLDKSRTLSPTRRTFVHIECLKIMTKHTLLARRVEVLQKPPDTILTLEYRVLEADRPLV